MSSSTACYHPLIDYFVIFLSVYPLQIHIEVDTPHRIIADVRKINEEKIFIGPSLGFTNTFPYMGGIYNCKDCFTWDWHVGQRPP